MYACQGAEQQHKIDFCGGHAVAGDGWYVDTIDAKWSDQPSDLVPPLTDALSIDLLLDFSEDNGVRFVKVCLHIPRPSTHDFSLLQALADIGSEQRRADYIVVPHLPTDRQGQVPPQNTVILTAFKRSYSALPSHWSKKVSVGLSQYRTNSGLH